RTLRRRAQRQGRAARESGRETAKRSSLSLGPPYVNRHAQTCTIFEYIYMERVARVSKILMHTREANFHEAKTAGSGPVYCWSIRGRGPGVCASFLRGHVF